MTQNWLTLDQGYPWNETLWGLYHSIELKSPWEIFSCGLKTSLGMLLLGRVMSELLI